MELIQLIIALGTFAPLTNYVGYGTEGSTNVSRYVDFLICRTIQFDYEVSEGGVYVLQISPTVNGGWETFGRKIVGPTVNNQTLSVPVGEGYFRIKQIKP